MTKVIKSSTIHFYADDCKIYSEHGGSDKLAPFEDLNNMVRRSQEREKISISINKCRVLHHQENPVFHPLYIKNIPSTCASFVYFRFRPG